MHDPIRRPVEVIAMHGWAGDSRCWKPWIEATTELGWFWQCGERGYGELQARETTWSTESPENALRIVIGHSLGPHLVAPGVLQRADAVVLLASFGTFVPPDRQGRRVRRALDGMAAKLRSEPEAKEMLRNFLAKAAAPQPADLLPPGPADGALNLGQLREDLEILCECEGLPRDFPENASILIIEASCDGIVDPMARSLLRQALPKAGTITFEAAGHALLETDVMKKVADFVESRR